MSIFLVWQSYQLLSVIHTLEPSTWGMSIFIAWIANMFVTGIFAFSGFAFPTQKLLPPSYYQIHNPTSLKNIYKLLKVDVFRKMLLATFWKSKSQRKKHFDGKKSGIQNLETQSMKSEFGHLIPFLILNFVSIYVIAVGSIRLGVLTLCLNLIGNLYPIILQRHHRMRIEKIRKRRDAGSISAKI